MSNLTFVVTHGAEVLFPLRDDAILIWLSNGPSPKGLPNQIIRAYEMYSAPEDLHRRMSGSMGTKAAYEYVNSLVDKPERVTIASYRKFNCKTGYGLPNWHFRRIPASSYLGMQIIGPTTPNPVPPFPSGIDEDFVVSTPRRFPEIMTQFANRHKLEYLLLLVTAGIHTGGLTRDEGLRALKEQRFIPGGIELGTFPYDFWHASMGRMLKAVDYYFEHFHKEVSSRTEQVRDVSFAMDV
ncbi:hypothetical protein [Rhodophyticola sp.]|jgi:hypothetical protein|uniref:hypothetical protein n=1 Tax=Rhodophyticola sp. TaxID=2680032 RepID=UPI003D297957